MHHRAAQVPENRRLLTLFNSWHAKCLIDPKLDADTGQSSTAPELFMNQKTTIEVE